MRPPRRQGARPDGHFIRTLNAARFAADVAGVPTILVARTDGAQRDTSDQRRRPRRPGIPHWRAHAGRLFRVRPGLDPAIARSLACAAYADVLWFETSTPDLGEAREFAQAVHELHPGKLLAYNCSPSFNWRSHLKKRQIASFQDDLAELGYRFQFVTLAGFHASTRRCSSSRTATRPAACPPTSSCRSGSSTSRSAGTPRHATSARSAPPL